MNQNLFVLGNILSLLALLTAAFCLWKTAALNKLHKTFFQSNQSGNLEEVILSLEQELKDSKQQLAAVETAVKKLQTDFTFVVQKVGLIRFNPFNDGGGSFSFCLALLDARNTGVIITSMHGREQNRIYTKKIENGKAEIQLTEEEQQAVEKANAKSETISKK